jgi:23S rRNA pseudouridine2605 synthase
VIADFLGDRAERLFHVGRLDYDTEGLMLLTNDGELAHRLAHPSYGVPKTYLAHVPGPIPRDLGKRLRQGIELEDGLARVDKFRVIDVVGKNAMIEVVIHEGRTHIVRRLLDAGGHPVKRLVRTRVGPVALGDQKVGRLRPLSRQEVGELYCLVGM